MSLFTDSLRYECDDGIAILTLDRPERGNAMSPAMVQGISSCVDHVDADPGVRALVITGAGRRFSVGAELAGDAGRMESGLQRMAGTGADRTRATAEPFREPIGLLAERFLASYKPIIAAVNGDAAGGGATMLCAMDARLATTTSRISFVFTRRGLTLEGAASWFLPRLVGMPTALDWTMSGRLVGAEEACQAGFVRSVHEPDELLAAACTFARFLTTETSPGSIALTRRLLWAGSSLSSPRAAHELESRLLVERAGSPDGREGMLAFMERRVASFDPVVEGQMPNWLSASWPDET